MDGRLSTAWMDRHMTTNVASQIEWGAMGAYKSHAEKMAATAGFKTDCEKGASTPGNGRWLIFDRAGEYQTCSRSVKKLRVPKMSAHTANTISITMLAYLKGAISIIPDKPKIKSARNSARTITEIVSAM